VLWGEIVVAIFCWHFAPASLGNDGRLAAQSVFQQAVLNIAALIGEKVAARIQFVFKRL
jgi:hypothetical protein